jgi:uncharacterized membrane protein
MWGTAHVGEFSVGLALVVTMGLAFAAGMLVLLAFFLLNRWRAKHPNLSEEDKEMIRGVIQRRYDTGEIDLAQYRQKLDELDHQLV